MSDFLSRLVQRTQGESPRVSPVVAPLFSTGPLLPAGAAESAGEEEGAAPATLERGAKTEATDTDLPSWRDGSPESLREEVVLPARLEGVPSLTPLPPGPDNALPALHASQGAAEREHLVPSPSSFPATAEASEVRPARVAESRTLAALPREEPGFLRPRLEEGTDRDRGTLTVPPAGRDPSPVIRVTIGRIEVRAVPSVPVPAARSAVTRKPPGTDLETYLKATKGSR